MFPIKFKINYNHGVTLKVIPLKNIKTIEKKNLLYRKYTYTHRKTNYNLNLKLRQRT